MKTRQILTGLFLSLSAQLAFAAGRAFHDDFEKYSAGALPNTQWSIPYGAPQVVSNAADGVTGPHAGSKMLRTSHPQSVDYDQLLPKEVSYTDEVFYRFWLRADKNHGGSAYPGTGCKYLRFYLFDEPAGPQQHFIDKFIVYHNSGNGLSNSGQFGLRDDNQDTYYGGASGDTSDTWTRWQKVEIYFNTTKGDFRIWNDGVLVREVLGRDVGALKATTVDLVSNGDMPDGLNYMYWDDIEIFSDQGTGATGQMSDATIKQESKIVTPQAPRNLVIR